MYSDYPSKLDKIIEEKLDFKLKVFAKQINYIDGGFTDLYIQKIIYNVLNQLIL